MSIQKVNKELGMYIAYGFVNGRETYGYGFSHLSAIASFLKNIW